jgi:putative endonuclease
MNTVETGRSGEQVAADFLEVRGYEILDFVEVRSRYSHRYGSPEASLTPSKLRGVRRTAEAWMARRTCYGMPCRFDVIAIDYSSGSLKVRHLENAF